MNNDTNNSSKSGSSPGATSVYPTRRGGGDTDTLRDALLLALLNTRELGGLVGEGESTLTVPLRPRDGTARANAVRSEAVIRPETHPLGTALPHADPPNSPGSSVADPNMMLQMQQIGRHSWYLDELVPQRESRAAPRADLLAYALEEAAAITSVELHPQSRSTLHLLFQADRRSRSMGSAESQGESQVAPRPTIADILEESLAMASSGDPSGITESTRNAQQDPAQRETQQEQ